MRVKTRAVLNATALITIAAAGRSQASAQAPPVCALVNGSWFNGKSFERRTVYTVNGRFTFRRPKNVEKFVDLAGTFAVPPFAEAHNHKIGRLIVSRPVAEDPLSFTRHDPATHEVSAARESSTLTYRWPKE
jgi:cytosine/adenosine deaminase-related metal-dependent hydrolase